jgi:hypothetical protein
MFIGYINSIHSFNILVIIIDGYWGKSKEQEQEQEKTRQLTVNIFYFKRELPYCKYAITLWL